MCDRKKDVTMKKREAFTLIELLVCVALGAILIGYIVSMIRNSNRLDDPNVIRQKVEAVETVKDELDQEVDKVVPGGTSYSYRQFFL